MILKPQWTPEKRLRVYASCKQLFTSELGQEVFGDLKEEFANRPSFIAGHPDETDFQEGERNVILTIMHRLETDLGALALALRQPAVSPEEYDV